MDNQFIFKEIQADYAARLSCYARELWHAAYDELEDIGAAQVDYMINAFQSTEALQSQLKEGNYRYYLIEYGGERAGYAGLKLEKNALFLSKLYLAPAFIGKGLGQKALNAVKSVAVENGLPEIYLTVNKHNARAFAAYERFGFIRTAETVTDIGGGYFMDDYIYTYFL